MNYKILISYDDADSFNKYPDQSKYIAAAKTHKELMLTDVVIGKANLKRIQAHYKAYLDIEQEGRFHFNKQKLEAMYKKVKATDWYVPKDDVKYGCGDDTWQSYIYLRDDNAERVLVYVFWAGYFESLNSAELEPDEDEMKVVI